MKLAAEDSLALAVDHERVFIPGDLSAHICETENNNKRRMWLTLV
jgi:hypothetical protein